MISDCQGVTFIGVVEKKMAQENCLLIKCYSECQFDIASAELSEGVSVKITRAIQNFTADNIEATDIPLLKLTPIWAIGLIIVASVFCIGFNIILITAYICWQRKKNYKRKAHISTITTLQAFNPT
uniref:Bm6627, isoform a n=1 Tax=Brugia malayi TaxID=6279 RepID=A0A1I9G0H9_BRUMA|nr:Bm6627, isoform a [Brugia malayi]